MYYTNTRRLLGLFCDASSSYGVGIVIDGRYDSLKFVHGWRTAHETPHDIGWAEALALELLIIFLFESCPLYNAHLLVHTDNTGVIGAWNKRSSRNEGINSYTSKTKQNHNYAVKRLLKFAAECGIKPSHVTPNRYAYS
jgi:hypothetical protein